MCIPANNSNCSALYLPATYPAAASGEAARKVEAN